MATILRLFHELKLVQDNHLYSGEKCNCLTLNGSECNATATETRQAIQITLEYFLHYFSNPGQHTILE